MNYDEESKIITYVQSCLGKPFRWGKHDCTLFVFDIADILVGMGLREQYQSKWSSAKTAHRFSLKNNVTVESVLQYLGAVDVRPNFEQFADFIIMDRELSNSKRWRTVGLCMGDGKAAIMTVEHGLVLVRMDMIPNFKTIRLVM